MLLHTSYLNDTLGLDDFEAFLQDEATMDKLNTLINIRKSDTGEYSLKDIAKSIAVFSACAEGINLFSSFAVLLSFRKSNRLIGIGQQMIFSIRDESLHSEAGCKLFRTLLEENPELNSDQGLYDQL
jgi:ribonucleoside-diphosphate reductase beta chain